MESFSIATVREAELMGPDAGKCVSVVVGDL